MPVKTFRSATNFLKPGKKAGLRTLNKLSLQASQLDQVQASIQAVLPDSLAAECRGVALNGDTFTVFCSSGAWATRLRFHEQLFRNVLLHGHNLKPSRLHYQVLPGTGPVNKTTRVKRDIPDTSREVINNCADSIDDPKLAAALKRLGKAPDR
ncbi:MAG TPA: DciA family protein [Gammaproteobacteria bacterium]|nr:DciA family protein [Gammaproteobacteria bacterium]